MDRRFLSLRLIEPNHHRFRARGCADGTRLLLLAGLVLGFGVASFASVARGQPGVEAQEITDLRLAVDDLAAEVRAERDRLTRTRERLATEALELELALRRAEAQLADARQRHADAQREEQRAIDRQKARVDGLLEAFRRLESMVRTGLPFRVEERLEALSELRADVRSGRLPPDPGTVRLWRLVRDELRLSETAGLGREVLEIDGERRLVEVARLGMVALLFRLPEGGTGYLRRVEGEGYRPVPAASSREQAAIESVFASLSSGRDPGRLEVPARSLVEASSR